MSVVRCVVLTSLLLLVLVVPARGATPLEACRLAVTKATGKLVAARFKVLDQCTAKVLKCLAGKPGKEAGCLTKEKGACEKHLAKLPTTGAKVVSDVTKKCGAKLTFEELLGASGLDYERIRERCVSLDSEATTVESLIQCLGEGTAQTTERLFALSLPRARELLEFAKIQTAVVPDLPANFDCADGAVCDLPRDALASVGDCTKALVKASRTFVAQTLASVTECTNAASACVDLDVTPKCRDKAQKTCDKATAKIAGDKGLRAKLAGAVAKACGPPLAFDALLGDDGADVKALECECAARGFGSLQGFDTYQACLLEQQECRVADLTRLIVPAGESDLDLVVSAAQDPLRLLCPSAQRRAPRAFGLGQFIRSIVRPSIFGRAITKTGTLAPRRGFSTILGVNRPRQIRPGGFASVLVKYRLPNRTAGRAAPVDPDSALVVRVRSTDGTFADDFLELPLTEEAADLDLVVQYEPTLSACQFDLSFATREGTDVSEFVSAAQSSEARLPGAPALTLDINTKGAGIGPSQMAAVGSAVFYRATDGILGQELWRTDGTAEGTRMVKDLNPGPGGSDPRLITDVDGVAFFATEIRQPDNTSVHQLWKSDGTPGATVPLQTFTEAIAFPVALNGALLFFANDGTAGMELWRSDGTTTARLKDINPGPGGSVANTFVDRYRPLVVGGTLYFVARDGVSSQLWKSDGTEAGTEVVTNFDPGTFPVLTSLTTLAGDVYFSFLGGGRFKVFRSNGTTAGTEAIFEGDNAQSTVLAATGNLVYFFALHAGVQALWKTDGTVAGTDVVADVEGAYLTAADDQVFFAVPATNPTAVWVSDGSAAGTAPVPTDPAVGAFFLRTLFGLGTPFVALGNDVYFGIASDASEGSPRRALAKSTGILTSIVKDVPSVAGGDSYRLANAGNTLYFSAVDAAGAELWKSDGTPGATARVADVDTSTAEAVDPLFEGATVGETLYFAATNDVDGRELFRSDGTAAGTSRVKDVNPGAGASSPFGFAALGSRAVFFADDGTTGAEPWITDGTEAGTTPLRDIALGAASSVVVAAGSPTVLGNLAVFPTTLGLWRTDGSSIGTIPVDQTVNLIPALGRGVVNGVLVFANDDGATGAEPWRSDGTPGGTRRLLDVRPPNAEPGVPAGSTPTVLASGASVVYFSADDGTAGRELWKTDGNAATSRVLDLNPGPANGIVTNTGATLGDVLFFEGDDGSGKALWKSDGTGPGTTKIAVFSLGITNLASAGGLVFFTEIGTGDLWRSDGTTGGTLKVGDLDTLPGGITALGDLVFLAGFIDPVGIEVVQSDGTVAGTRPIGDINPGTGLNSLSKLGARIYATPTAIFFSADDGTSGRELWTLAPKR